MKNQLSRRLVIILPLLVTSLIFVIPVAWESGRVTSSQQPTVRPLAALPTHTHTSTPPATETATVVLTPTPSNTVDPSITPSPTLSPTPTDTSTPALTATPTSLPQSVPTLSVTGVGRIRDGVPTPATPIPSPVPTFDISRDITNILLLGNDSDLESGDSRTDTIIIVSVNQERKTAAMVSIPRDLYVYMPGRTMGRINTAVRLGGVELLEQAILYNFGVPIHYYARVDFDGFQSAVDAIGGVDIGVSCRFEDWRIISPELDPEDPDSWERFALEPGMYHMDGETALWYARSRLSSNDFDRGRRQQQLLRALLNQGVDLGIVSQVPQLWNTFQDSVETDIDIGRLLQLAALAPSIQENGVQNLYLAGKTEAWTVPTTGAFVQLPIWEGENMMGETFLRFFLPPALNQATRPPIFVEVVNQTDNPDLAALAADNLAWHGFVPIITVEQTENPVAETSTQLTYFGPNLKGSYDWLITWVLGTQRSDIELIADRDDSAYNYQVILGNDYDPCTQRLYAPRNFIGE